MNESWISGPPEEREPQEDDGDDAYDWWKDHRDEEE